MVDSDRQTLDAVGMNWDRDATPGEIKWSGRFCAIAGPVLLIVSLVALIRGELLISFGTGCFGAGLLGILLITRE